MPPDRTGDDLTVDDLLLEALTSWESIEVTHGESPVVGIRRHGKKPSWGERLTISNLDEAAF